MSTNISIVPAVPEDDREIEEVANLLAALDLLDEEDELPALAPRMIEHHRR